MSGIGVHAAVAGRGVELDLDLPAGHVTAVAGPNGAGKTTLLHLIAGLVRPSSGRVEINGQVVADARRFVPPHRRHAVLLTQDTALFPHMTVLTNVAFGPESSGVTRQAARLRARDELDAVGCGDLAERRPHELSGGQAQRVAIARALATDPAVVLLDEPLAGLDVATAAEVRHALRRRLTGRTALLVTHEVLDVWTIADRVAVISDGGVEVHGDTATVLRRPTSNFLARLGGTNLFTGTATAADTVTVAPDVQLRGLVDHDQPIERGSAALASVSPAAISLHRDDPGGSPRNVLGSTVTSVEPRGDIVRVHLIAAEQPFAADLTPQAVAELDIRPGMRVRAVVKATQVRLYGP